MRLFLDRLLPAFGAPDNLAGGGGAPAAMPAETSGMPADAPEDVVLNEFSQLLDPESEEEPYEITQTPPGLEPGGEIPPVTEDRGPRVPAQAPVVATQPGTTPPVTAGAAPAQAQAAAPQAVGEQPIGAAEVNLGALVEALRKQESDFVKVLAQSQYKLSTEDLERFQTEPSEVIAEVAARVQAQTTASVMQVLANVLPQQMLQVMRAKATNDTAETAFWAANPHLDASKHHDMVVKAGTFFRQQFPKADRATFQKQVGAMVSGMLGLTANVLTKAAPNGHGGVAEGTPGRVVRAVSPAYQPAGAHSAPGVAPPMENEWSRITRLMEVDEDLFDG